MRASESVNVSDLSFRGHVGSSPLVATRPAYQFASSFATMDAFLQTVDVAPPANVAALVAGLSAGGYAEPEHLNMAEANEVLSVFPADGEGKLAPPDKSFLRRAIMKASMPPLLPPVAAAAVVNPPELPVQIPRSDRLQDLFGMEISAESVASALAAKPPPVDVHDLLTKAECASLPSALIVDVSVWQALAADSLQAKKKGRQAFTYVDLTSKVMLPPWLPADALVVKKGQERAPALEPGADTLQVLSVALQNATVETRQTKSFQQWVAIFLRYVPLAVATGQWTWPVALSHMATITKLAETERLHKTTGWIALQYDEAIRKSWSRRLLQGDPDVDIPREAAIINEEVLDEVRSRDLAKAAAPASSSSSSRTAGAQPSWEEAAAEGALAKVGAAAQAMSKRAEAASREIAQAEKHLSSREEALKGDTYKKGQGKGGKAGKAGKGGKGGWGGQKRKHGGKWW